MANLELMYYETLLKKINRKNSNGVRNRAKPILLLSIFELIESKYYKVNKIYYCDTLKKQYQDNWKEWSDSEKTTPIVYPFFHLKSEEFYKLVCINKEIVFPHTPSDAFLNNNVLFSSFDNALWDLLQSKDNLSRLKTTIIDTHLKKQ